MFYNQWVDNFEKQTFTDKFINELVFARENFHFAKILCTGISQSYQGGMLVFSQRYLKWCAPSKTTGDLKCHIFQKQLVKFPALSFW